MNRVGRSLIFVALLSVLMLVSFGDLFPQFNVVDDSAIGLSSLLGVSYARSLDLFAAASLVLVGVCYWVAIKRRI